MIILWVFNLDETIWWSLMFILNLILPCGNYVADWVLFTRTGLLIPVGWALFWVISTSVIHKKDDLMSGTSHSLMATGKRLPCSILSFHTSLRLPNLITREETPQALGVIRNLSRIDRIFINLPMAEVRDFHCYSHVFENLVKENIPSDHAGVRLVIQKPTMRGH